MSEHEPARFAVEESPETGATGDTLLLRIQHFGLDEVLPFTRAELLRLASAIIEALGAPRPGGGR